MTEFTKRLYVLIFWKIDTDLSFHTNRTIFANQSKMWFFCCCAVRRYEGLKLHPVLSDCDEIYAVQRSDILIELIKHQSKNGCYKVTKFINVLNLFNPTIVNSYIAGFIFENFEISFGSYIFWGWDDIFCFLEIDLIV